MGLEDGVAGTQAWFGRAGGEGQRYIRAGGCGHAGVFTSFGQLYLQRAEELGDGPHMGPSVSELCSPGGL
jgi:hypothetical protein